VQSPTFGCRVSSNSFAIHGGGYDQTTAWKLRCVCINILCEVCVD